MAKLVALGRGFPRFFARACPGGWLICDHSQREQVWRHGCPYEDYQQGKRLHTDPIPDHETARSIALGLNSGRLRPEDLSEPSGSQP